MLRAGRVAFVAALLSAGAVHALDAGEAFGFSPRPAGGDEAVWYLVDWGDGTLSPTACGLAAFSPRLSKVWNRPGTYRVRSLAVTASGRTVRLGSPVRAEVSGEALEPPEPLEARAFGQDGLDAPMRLGKRPRPASSAYISQSIGLRFDGIRRLDALLLGKSPSAPFPDTFAVEYSTDGGTIWNDVPSADFSHFPTIGKKTVRIPLHGLAANAVRVVAHRLPSIGGGRCALRLGSLEAEGGQELLFEMDADPQMVADWNNMWLVFGSAQNEVLQCFNPWTPTERPGSGGLLGIGSTIWTHWNAMKLAWLDRPDAQAQFERQVNRFPQDAQGLVGVAPGEFFHLGHSKHYVTPAICAAGLSYWFLNRRDSAFLEQTDGKQTLLERMRKAMRYQLEEMDGRSGVLTIKDPEHDGTASGKSSNYWDVWPFGYQSAYANIRFYESLGWMARLEAELGEVYRSTYYRDLRRKVKKRFNELFWNDVAGRFVGAVDVHGVPHDYGFTFVNLEAIAAGLATPEHARSVFQWLDGERIVAGDTSTGADIYRFKAAPRVNTLAVESFSPPWWDGWNMKVGPGTMGEYGKQIQNGGLIFYVSHYDLMARLRTLGVENAMRRMQTILTEFHKDQLRRQPGNGLGSTHVWGFVREFPESGLVPLFFVTGILGIEPDAAGLRIEPNLPEGWDFAGIGEYVFAGKKYRIRIERGLAAPVVEGTDVRIPAAGRWTLRPNGEVLAWKPNEER